MHTASENAIDKGASSLSGPTTGALDIAAGSSGGDVAVHGVSDPGTPDASCSFQRCRVLLPKGHTDVSPPPWTLLNVCHLSDWQSLVLCFLLC
jgi:hypothetical protein